MRFPVTLSVHRCVILTRSDLRVTVYVVRMKLKMYKSYLPQTHVQATDLISVLPVQGINFDSARCGSVGGYPSQCRDVPTGHGTAS